MTPGKLEAAQQRLTRLLEQKKALEAKISREQGLLRERERKAHTRRLIEYGGLVAIAGLDKEDKGTVLGLLLEGARRLAVDGKAQRRWKVLGDQEFAARAVHAVEDRTQKRVDDTGVSTGDGDAPNALGNLPPGSAVPLDHEASGEGLREEADRRQHRSILLVGQGVSDIPPEPTLPPEPRSLRGQGK